MGNVGKIENTCELKNRATVAVSTTRLPRCFGDLYAVNELNLSVESGKFYGFLGPNSAGKSTTIKMLTG